MNTFILNAETANLSIEHLLKRANEGGVEVRDAQGNVLAFVLSPNDHEAWTYAEANFDITQNFGEVQQAIGRRGGPGCWQWTRAGRARLTRRRCRTPPCRQCVRGCRG